MIKKHASTTILENPMKYDNIVVGLTNAAKVKGWSAGKFGGYFYTGRAPKHIIIDKRPAWKREDLLAWEPTRLNGQS